MSRTGPYKKVQADFWQGRVRNARDFHSAAQTLFELHESGQNTNPIMVQVVEATIAYADAVTARRDSRINQQDHQALGALLRAILGNRLPNQQLANLNAILGEKDAVSYGARPGSAVQARRMLERLDAFAAWVEEELAH
jgi:hypothetical protein